LGDLCDGVCQNGSLRSGRGAAKQVITAAERSGRAWLAVPAAKPASTSSMGAHEWWPADNPLQPRSPAARLAKNP
jgi:hypothetical protein